MTLLIDAFLGSEVSEVPSDSFNRWVGQSVLKEPSEDEYGPDPGRQVELTRDPTSGRWTVGNQTEAFEGKVSLTTTAPIHWGGGVFGAKDERVVGQIMIELGSTTYILVERIFSSEADLHGELAPVVEAVKEGKPLPIPFRTSEGLPRFSMRVEGPALVVRDELDRGPTTSVKRYATLAGVAALSTVASGYVLWQQIQLQAGTTRIVAHSAVAFVLFMTTVAMAEIARFASKYKGSNTPLAWFGNDRLVIRPWVSRTGAANLLAEGRFGAAIPSKDIHEVRLDGTAVIVDGKHEPIELARAGSEREAKELATAVRALMGMAQPATT